MNKEWKTNSLPSGMSNVTFQLPEDWARIIYKPNGEIIVERTQGSQAEGQTKQAKTQGA